MLRGQIEQTLSIDTTVDTLDEALTFAVQELDSHRFKPGTYLIEITSVIDDDDNGDEFTYFEVTVQGNLDDRSSP